MAQGGVKKRKKTAAPGSKKRGKNPILANLRTGGFIGIEKKYLDTSKVASALTAPTNSAGGEHDPATLDCLNAIAQGDTEQQRDGKQVVLDSVWINGHVQSAAVEGITSPRALQSYFVALILDTQTNGAQLNSEDVFTNPGANASTNTLPLHNLQYSKRFKLLRKWHLTRAPLTLLAETQNSLSADGQCYPFSGFVKLGIPCNFTGTTGVISNIMDNSLHVIAYTNSTDGTPSISYNARVRFRG